MRTFLLCDAFPCVVRTIGCYADAIVIRHPESGSARTAAKYSKVPILNAGDGIGEHPTQVWRIIICVCVVCLRHMDRHYAIYRYHQAFLDVYTVREELGTVNGLTITLVGDLKNGRTVHSLVKLLALYDVKINYVSPESLRMPEEVQQELRQKGIAQVEHSALTEDLIAHTDVLYVTRIQKERFARVEDYEQVKDSYRITNALLKKAKSSMIIMHPLPRVNEIDPEVDFDQRAAYFRQMKYGLYVRMALLALVLAR